MKILCFRVCLSFAHAGQSNIFTLVTSISYIYLPSLLSSTTIAEFILLCLLGQLSCATSPFTEGSWGTLERAVEH